MASEDALTAGSHAGPLSFLRFGPPPSPVLVLRSNLRLALTALLISLPTVLAILLLTTIFDRYDSHATSNVNGPTPRRQGTIDTPFLIACVAETLYEIRAVANLVMAEKARGDKWIGFKKAIMPSLLVLAGTLGVAFAVAGWEDRRGRLLVFTFGNFFVHILAGQVWCLIAIRGFWIGSVSRSDDDQHRPKYTLNFFLEDLQANIVNNLGHTLARYLIPFAVQVVKLHGQLLLVPIVASAFMVSCELIAIYLLITWTKLTKEHAEKLNTIELELTSFLLIFKVPARLVRLLEIDTASSDASLIAATFWPFLVLAQVFGSLAPRLFAITRSKSAGRVEPEDAVSTNGVPAVEATMRSLPLPPPETKTTANDVGTGRRETKAGEGILKRDSFDSPVRRHQTVVIDVEADVLGAAENEGGAGGKATLKTIDFPGTSKMSPGRTVSQKLVSPPIPASIPSHPPPPPQRSFGPAMAEITPLEILRRGHALTEIASTFISLGLFFASPSDFYDHSAAPRRPRSYAESTIVAGTLPSRNGSVVETLGQRPWLAVVVVGAVSLVGVLVMEYVTLWWEAGRGFTIYTTRYERRYIALDILSVLSWILWIIAAARGLFAIGVLDT
ncbi:hypothetical protein HDU96_008590 [Phlyctochytrium bullatum]|nr:hypothetical protein HDU96_008590 [Phlyctochytrium bullatum]